MKPLFIGKFQARWIMYARFWKKTSRRNNPVNPTLNFGPGSPCTLVLNQGDGVDDPHSRRINEPLQGAPSLFHFRHRARAHVRQ